MHRIAKTGGSHNTERIKNIPIYSEKIGVQICYRIQCVLVLVLSSPSASNRDWCSYENNSDYFSRSVHSPWNNINFVISCRFPNNPFFTTVFVYYCAYRSRRIFRNDATVAFKICVEWKSSLTVWVSMSCCSNEKNKINPGRVTDNSEMIECCSFACRFLQALIPSPSRRT